MVIALSMSRLYSRRAVKRLKELRKLSQTRTKNKEVTKSDTQGASLFVGGTMRKRSEKNVL